ncbi:hypothetical protein [Clostridium algidicarnis]|uniref:Uncharacterized protein n=1 Tax=Clostridium algidicarnis DSM 15099 TaxID=1121295 RepID=A0A2S6FUU7_9CLOT|nr:hypothetical protein [Clostridium algidicarnis]MBB6630652.1 hypothetical protein [Clostridium algidicarnis]PPK44995.1 hypothetical protein BD821_12141 [Clostridium algidicarnis DSM 15099]
MLIENENAICQELYQYIKFDLYDCIDSEIFTKSTMQELGEFYFNKAVGSVDGANDRLLNIVIKSVLKNNEISMPDDFYISLCKIIGIKDLPNDKLVIIQEEYDKIFIQLYGTVLNKADVKIDLINTQLLSIKRRIASVESKKPTLSLVRDLATEENLLQECHRECNELRTQKEMILFSKQHMERQLNRFCNLGEPQSVQDILQGLALKLSKDTITIMNASLEFSFYREVLEIAEDHLDRPYALFFKVKLYTAIDALHKNWHFHSYTKSDEDRVAELNLAKDKIPSIDELHTQKNSNPQLYLNTLRKFVLEHDVINELSKLLEKSVCLIERKEVLLKSITLFQSDDFIIFNHIVPLQIEGMFGDFLKDATTFNRFTNMAIYINDVLKEKIQHLQDIQVDTYPEVVEYFMYYFNNLIRNRIAHGNYKALFNNSISAEIFAHELLLDLSILVHMLSRKSETDKMHCFISGYKTHYSMLIKSEENPHFGAMFNDMIGNKIISDYDSIEKNRPLQVAYWLVNPYYERIFESTGDKTDLIELRTDFLSKEFWEYVVDSLTNRIETNFGYQLIDMEFLAVVNGLFKCDISPDVRVLLGKANAALQQIKKMQRQ